MLISIVKRISEDSGITILGVLCSAFTFVVGVVCTKYKVKEWFHHKRIWIRLLVCLAVLIVAVYFSTCVVAAVIFVLFIMSTTVFPVLHEVILLHYYKTHPQALAKDRYRSLLITTNALLLFYELRIKTITDVVKKQDVQVKFLDEAKHWDLFDKECKRYYLPNLDVLFRIGAINAFRAECQRLQRFESTSYMHNFKTYLAHNEFDYEKMEQLESQCSDKDDNSRVVFLLNRLCAYEASGEKEKMKAIISDLLKIKQKGILHVELYHSLMHYYDEIAGDKNAADSLADEISQMNIASFEDYLNLMDTAFMHYRRNGNQQKVNGLIERVLAENECKQTGGDQMVTRIKMMYVIYDNGCKWQDYSIKLFADRAKYLDAGYRVGATFIMETARLLRDVNLQQHQGLLPLLEKELFEDFEKYSASYISDIENDIAKLDDRFLYRRRNLLMMKGELLKLKVGSSGVLLRKYNDEIFDRITEMCQCCDEQREYLHFLVVHADDILTVDHQIMEHAKVDAMFSSSKQLREYESHRLAYITKATDIVGKIENIIKRRNYDKSLAYYVVYVAYFYMLLGNKQQCLFFFMMFNRYDVDIRNWTKPIQQICYKLREYAVLS